PPAESCTFQTLVAYWKVQLSAGGTGVAALSSTQPAFGIGLTDADVAVLWRDVQITHYHDALGGIEILLQMGLQVCIESGLGGELDRVVPALALGEISIEHDQWLAIGTGQGGADHPA